MLKQELEKQLGYVLSDSFYQLANERYTNGTWKNDNQFCEELTQDRLLMRALYERSCMLKALGEVTLKLQSIIDKLNKQVK